MQSEEQIIEQMKMLGLSTREGRLYCALLKMPEATASMLHRLSGVPRTKIYETLEALIFSGFCLERVGERQKYYRAIAPDMVLDLMKSRWSQETKQKEDLAQTVFGDLQSLFSQRGDSERSLDFIEVIRSREQINKRYVSLVNGATEEILGFLRSPFAAPGLPGAEDEQNVAELEAGDRHLQQRMIYMYEQEHLGWLRQNLQLGHETGENLRICKSLPMKMFIFDRKIILFALPSVPGLTGCDFTMLVIEDPGLAESCRILFEVKWGESLELDDWTAEHGKII
jgi:hypothetical protein